MNKKQILLALLTVDFLALTAWAVSEHGYLGVFARLLDNSATMLFGADLAIAIGLVAVWMVVDARRHGLSVAPFLLATATLGSAGPLLYLIRRESALRRGR